MQDDIDYIYYAELYGGKNRAARQLGIPKSTFKDRYNAQKQSLNGMPVYEEEQDLSYFKTPDPVQYNCTDIKPRHFILSSAQNGTEIHKEFWNNLKAYADFLNATIMIGAYGYRTSLYQKNNPSEINASIFYAKEIEPYMVYDPVNIGDHISFVAGINILPTAVNPLAGLDTHTKHRNGIFPHPKVQLKTQATLKHERPKQNLTTGSITLTNYERKKAGMKAEFHHRIGAVIVSICPDGSYYYRHINADDDGSFYDLDRYVYDGLVSWGNRVHAIIHGDIHIEQIDEIVQETSWGHKNSLTSILRPEYRVFHDLSDFTARNHHNIDNHYHLYQTNYCGTNEVKVDLKKARDFLNKNSRPDIKDIVIQSNHNNALMKWVQNGLRNNVQRDSVNYRFWLECELKIIKAIEEGNKDYNLYVDVLRDMKLPNTIEFVAEDESFFLQDIQIAVHGHLGANGARGSASTFVKMSDKSITAHTHSPSITDGHMCVGTNSKLDLGYNKGLSSWSHTNAIVYPNGHRCLISLMNGRWFV